MKGQKTGARERKVAVSGRQGERGWSSVRTEEPLAAWSRSAPEANGGALEQYRISFSNHAQLGWVLGYRNESERSPALYNSHSDPHHKC